MYGRKGLDNSGFSGGNGGQSRIQITPTRDVEYTLVGISNNSALFLYRGSNLICVGLEEMGTSGDGGDGGGVSKQHLVKVDKVEQVEKRLIH